MLLGMKPLTFKVDPLTTGSDALVVGNERCLRALASRPGEKFTMPPREKLAAIEHDGHQDMKP